MTVRADDGCHLWTAATGDGTPLLMCHAGPGLWDMFGSLAAALPASLRVIRWDQRGGGRSERRAWRESFERNITARLAPHQRRISELRAAAGDRARRRRPRDPPARRSLRPGSAHPSVIRTDRFSVAGPASRVPAALRSRVNWGKSLPTPVVLICAPVAPRAIRTARTWSARRTDKAL